MGHPPLPLTWGLAAVTASAVTASFFAVLYMQPVPWQSLLYLLTVPLPFFVVGVMLTLKGHLAGRYLLLGASLGPGIAAPVGMMVESRYAVHGIESWMPWTLLTEAMIGTLATSAFAILVGLFPACVARTPAERWFVRVMWCLPIPMALALVANEHLLTEQITYGDLPQLPNPIHVPLLAGFGPYLMNMREIFYLAIAAGIVLLILRYRGAKPNTRRSMRWVLFGNGIAVAIGAAPFLVQPIVGLDAPADGDVLTSLTTFAIPAIPLTILVALEPPRWLNADAVMRKSFIYGALTFGILVVYAAVAAGLGLTAGVGLPVELAIGLSAVLAISFQPVRERLRTIADRWVFGTLPQKSAVLTETNAAATTVHAQADPAAAGEQLALLVRAAVRLHWVAVSLPPMMQCTVGIPAGKPALVVPLIVEDAQAGEIACGQKLAGRLTPNRTSIW